jgi:glycerophosphoryl diester phosphodiesterase
MKDLTFLTKYSFLNKGFYNNKTIYENTLESFKEAIRLNKGIYFNLRLTKDNVLVVYDEEDLSRLLNLKDEINDTNYDELSYLCNYHIPTLTEVLTLIAGKVPILINPKVFNNKYYLEKEMSKVLDNYKGNFAIINNNPIVIKWFNDNKKNYIVGEALTKKKTNIHTFSNFLANYFIKPDFKSVNIDYYDSRDINELRETNNILIGYLIDNKKKNDTYKDLFDNLITDLK